MKKNRKIEFLARHLHDRKANELNRFVWNLFPVWPIGKKLREVTILNSTLAIISLLILVSVIITGFVLKKNVGLVAILAATIFGASIGETDSIIIKGFSSSTFIMLLGVSLLCTIATNNGTLELTAKKFLNLSGGHVKAAPIIMYLIGYIIAAIGPGCVPALGIVAALSLPLSKTTGYNSVMLAAIGEIGSMAGRFSPLTPESVLIGNLAQAQGITGYQSAVLIYSTVTTIVLSFVIYFLYKGYKVKEITAQEQEALPALNRKQLTTLAGFLVMIVLCAAFKRNVGLISFAVSIVLLIFNVDNEKATIKAVPWSTLMMVTGVGMAHEHRFCRRGRHHHVRRPGRHHDPEKRGGHPGTVRRAPFLVQLCHRCGMAHHGAYGGFHCRTGGSTAGRADHHHVPDGFFCRIQPCFHWGQPDPGSQCHGPCIHQRKGKQDVRPDVRPVRPAADPDGFRRAGGPVQCHLSLISVFTSI